MKTFFNILLALILAVVVSAWVKYERKYPNTHESDFLFDKLRGRN